MNSKTLGGMAFATLAAVLWALTLGASALLPSGFPTSEVVAGRYGIQLLLLLVLVLPFRRRALVATAQPKLQMLRGMMMLAMPVAFTLAVHRIGPADAWAVLWFAPLFGMALAVFLLGESAPRAWWAVAGLATVGAVVAHGPIGRPTLGGAVAAAVAAASFGTFLVLTRALKSEGATTGLFWTAICVFVPASFIVPLTWQPITARALLGMAVMGVLWGLVLLTIDEALRRAPVGLIAPFLLTEIIWARLLYRLPWAHAALVGAAAIVVAAAAAVYLTLRARETQPLLDARTAG